MRKNKRIILIVLLIIAVAVIWIKASANDNTGDINFSAQQTVSSGDTFDVNISVNTPDSQFVSMAGYVYYDNSLFSLVSGGTDNAGGFVAVYSTSSSFSLTFRATGNEGSGQFYFLSDDFNVALNDTTPKRYNDRSSRIKFKSKWNRNFECSN